MKTNREVLFLDTADFRLYNNAFILRRRLRCEHGFAVGPPEFVFKFRHPDLEKTAEMDVRLPLETNYEVEVKAEPFPLKDQIGGVRCCTPTTWSSPSARRAKSWP